MFLQLDRGRENERELRNQTYVQPELSTIS